MSWTENKVLLEYSEHTPCKDIFQAVCNELGSYYSTKGFKYSPSRPKIVGENGNIKLEIGFSSSRSNMPGNWVNLEILPGFYSKQLKKKGEADGFLFGHTGIFYHKYKDDKTQIRVNKIFGDVLERTDEYSDESKIIDSNNCNVYGLDEVRFNMILNFIDTKIIYWLHKIQTKEGIQELLTNASPTRVWALGLKESDSGFVKYIQLNFPDVNIKKELAK